MDPFPKRTDDMIHLRTGAKVKMPSIDPKQLPLRESTCGSCNTRWGTRNIERKSDPIERPFILPCQHLVGSVCLAALLAQKSPHCPTCLVSVEYEVYKDPPNDCGAVEADTREDRESSLSSAPQSPTWSCDSGKPTSPTSSPVETKLAKGGRPSPDSRMKIGSIINETAMETPSPEATSDFPAPVTLGDQRPLPAADHCSSRTTASGPPNKKRDERPATETQNKGRPRSDRSRNKGPPLYNTRYHPMDPWVKAAKRVSGEFCEQKSSFR